MLKLFSAVSLTNAAKASLIVVPFDYGKKVDISFEISISLLNIQRYLPYLSNQVKLFTRSSQDNFKMANTNSITMEINRYDLWEIK